MALAHIHYWSQALEGHSALTATWPDDARERLPVVYLLHGQCDDHTVWQRRTSIERYAERHRLMVVMPDCGRSFSCDSALGSWERHLLDTIDYVDRVLPTRPTAAARGIGGLSMGGYGAMKLALKHPGRFASAAAHSGCFDMVGDRRVRALPDLQRMFPGGVVPPEDDCFALARRLSGRRGRRPALRFDCGTEDFLLGHSRAFHAHLAALRMAHEYVEHPGGHSWEYWDEHVDAALRFHRRHFDGAATAAPRPRRRAATTRRPRTRP